jgi:hypothetical protein
MKKAIVVIVLLLVVAFVLVYFITPLLNGEDECTDVYYHTTSGTTTWRMAHTDDHITYNDWFAVGFQWMTTYSGHQHRYATLEALTDGIDSLNITPQAKKDLHHIAACIDSGCVDCEEI